MPRPELPSTLTRGGSSLVSRGGRRRSTALGGENLSLRDVLKHRAADPESVFFKTLDWLAVGQQLAAGVTYELVRRLQGRPAESIGQAALRGIRSKQSFRSVTREPISGLILDMLIDPINLIPAGGAAKLGRTSAVVGKQLRKVPAVNRIMDSFGEKFVTNYVLKRANLNEFIDAKMRLIGRANNVKAQKLSDAELKILELVPDDARRNVVSQLVWDSPSSRKNPYWKTWHEEVAKLSNDEKAGLDLSLKTAKELEQMKLGMEVLEKGQAEGFLSKLGVSHYLPMRFVSRDAFLSWARDEAVALQSAIKAQKRVLYDIRKAGERARGLKSGGKVVAQRTERKLAESRLKEASRQMKTLNAWMERVGKAPGTLTTGQRVQMKRMHRAGYIKFLEERTTDVPMKDMDGKLLEALETDIVKQLRIERLETTKAAINQQYMVDAVQLLKSEKLLVNKITGEGGEGLLKRGLKDTDLVPSDIKELEGFLIPRAVAGDIERAMKAYKDPSEMKEMLSVWRQTTGIWKAWTLSLFPAYHSRNVVSNIWNNFLAGMGRDSMQHYREAWHLGQKFRTGRFDDRIIRGIGKTDREMYEAALTNRIIDGGQFSEISQVFSDAVPSLVPNFLDPRYNRAIQAGYKTGRVFEDHARLSHFMWRMSKGDSMEDAARSVQKFLFDYQYGLTSFESKFLRDRMIPFWAWTRFNIPLQLEMLIDKPRKFVNTRKVLRAWEDEFGGPEPDEMFLATWLKKSGKIRLWWDKDKNTYQYFMLDSWWPAADLGKIMSASKGGQELLNMITPILKMPVELLFNYNLFKHRGITQFEGQRRKILNVSLPARLEHIARSIRVVNEADRLMDSMSKRYGEGIPGRIGRTGIRAIFGKTYPVDIEKQRKTWAFATLAQLRELKKLQRIARKRGEMGNVERIEKQMGELNDLRKNHLGIFR